eukprot:6107783-Prymnesium_polylepis.1
MADNPAEPRATCHLIVHRCLAHERVDVHLPGVCLRAATELHRHRLDRSNILHDEKSCTVARELCGTLPLQQARLQLTTADRQYTSERTEDQVGERNGERVFALQMPQFVRNYRLRLLRCQQVEQCRRAYHERAPALHGKRVGVRVRRLADVQVRRRRKVEQAARLQQHAVEVWKLVRPDENAGRDVVEEHSVLDESGKALPNAPLYWSKELASLGCPLVHRVLKVGNRQALDELHSTHRFSLAHSHLPCGRAGKQSAQRQRHRCEGPEHTGSLTSDRRWDPVTFRCRHRPQQ